jgi:hypothetical protein
MIGNRVVRFFTSRSGREDVAVSTLEAGTVGGGSPGITSGSGAGLPRISPSFGTEARSALV